MARLGDVCKKASSNIAQKDLEGHHGKYPIYGASGFISNVDFYQQEEPYIAVVKDGAGIGRVMKLPAKSSVIGTLQYIIPNDTVDIQYLAYAMEYMNLSKYFSGATIPHIYFKDYQNETLPLPSLNEQRRIAATLDKVTELIAKRRQQLDKLDELVKAKFVELTEESSCSLVRMGDIATYINGYAFKPDDWKTDGKPIIRIQNLNDPSASYNHFNGELDSKYKVQNGDVLISWATHFEAYVWHGNDAWLNQHIFKVVFNKKQINKIYFVYSTEEALKQAFRNAHGFKPTMEHLKRSDFENAVVKLPNFTIQSEFEEFERNVQLTKLTAQKSLSKLVILKKSLMQEYFGG